MKRYWKIISLLLLTLFVIGTFYIQSSLASKEAAEVKFEKIKGNEAEINDLTFFVDIEIGNMIQSFRQRSTNETIPLNNQSLLEQLKNDYHSPSISKLIKEQRNFMRSKDKMANKFFENGNVVAYATIDGENLNELNRDFYFDIQVLDKKKNEVSSINMNVPEKEKYSWFEIIDVQIINDQLKVIAKGNLTNGGNLVNVYSFNLEDEELLSHETIISVEASKNGWSDLTINSNYSFIESENYHIITTRTYDTEGEEGSEYSGLASHDVSLYNVKENKLEKLEVPVEMLDFINNATIHESKLYIPTHVENGVEMNEYDIEKGEWGQKKTFEFQHEKDISNGENEENTPFIKLNHGKVYFVYKTAKDRILTVADLSTGETLYEGKIIAKLGKNQIDRLYINDIE